MSTIFGILKKGLEHDKIIDENGEIYPYIDKDYCFKNVYYRGDNSYWIHGMASFILDEIKVYPLDNSAQGIYTIGDCHKALEEQKINRKNRKL